MVIQFICRGNAFRSIIAEAYLKSLRIPNLTVVSSGTVASAYKAANLANFPKTLAMLERHGVREYAKTNFADDTRQDLLDKSDVIVFMNTIAYDEAAKSFTLPPKTFIWDVADIGEKNRIANNEEELKMRMEEVYAEIVANTDELISAQLHLR